MSDEKIPKGSWPAMIFAFIVTIGFYLGIDSLGKNLDGIALASSVVVFFVLIVAFSKMFTK